MNMNSYEFEFYEFSLLLFKYKFSQPWKASDQ